MNLPIGHCDFPLPTDLEAKPCRVHPLRPPMVQHSPVIYNIQVEASIIFDIPSGKLTVCS